MSDMSFTQAKQLVERFELTELTLKKTFENIKKSLLIFNNTLKQQEKIIQLIPKTDAKLNTMKIIVALNVGLIIGLIIGKYFI
jgi:hypothetical protein